MRIALLGLSLLVLGCPMTLNDRCGPGLPSCPSNRVCVEARCVLIIDAGMTGGGSTAGGTSGGGTAGGSVVDAGARVLSVTDLAQYAQLDGGLVGYPRAGETINAMFRLGDGGVLRFPLATDGGGQFVSGVVPRGEWLAEVIIPGAVTWLFEASGDTLDLSSAVGSGRPGVSVAGTTPMNLNLTALEPWETGDTVEITSHSSGTVFLLAPPASDGGTTVVGTLDTYYARGPSLTRADVFRVYQRRFERTDAGNTVLSSVRWTELTGQALPSEPLVGVLRPFPSVGTVSISFDGGQLRAALDGLEPGCQVAFADRLASTSFEYLHTNLSLTELQDRVTVRGVDAKAGTLVACSATLTLDLPLLDGGLERDPNGAVVQYFDGRELERWDDVAIDGGTVTAPTLSVPRAVRIDGSATALFISLTPRIEWTAPSTGTPQLYSVSVSEFEPRGIAYSRRPFLAMQTTRTSVVVPPGFLRPATRYLVLVVAIERTGPIGGSRSRTFSHVVWTR